MILYLVDESRGVFETRSDGYSLCLDLNLRIIKICIYVASRMASGQYHRSAILPFLTCGKAHGLDAHDGTGVDDETRHLRLVMHLAAGVDDSVAHGLDDAWQLVGANMRMGVAKNV